MADRSHGFANFNFLYDCGTIPFKKFMAKKNNPCCSKEHGSNKYWTFYCNEANISSCVIDGLKCFLFTDTFLICVYHYFTLMIWVKCYFYDLDVTLSLVMKMTAIFLNYMISSAI